MEAKSYQYSLLDGVNRLDAMELVGIDFEIDRDDRLGWTVSIGRNHPRSADVRHNRGCDNPFAFVLSVNLHRRHLTVEQKARPDRQGAQGAAIDVEPAGCEEGWC